MKKGKLLLSLVALLLISSGALVALNYSNQTKSEAPIESTTSSSESLISLEKSGIKELTLTDPNGNLSFIPTENAWEIKDAPAIDLQTNVINSTCNSLLQISSYRTFEEPNLTEFGLTNSSLSIQYVLTDETSIELLLGNKTPDGNNFYALKDGDTSKAYLIPAYKGNEISSSLDKFRIKSLDTLERTLVSEFKASGRDIKTFVIEPSETTSNMTAFTLTSPTTKSLNIDSSALEKLFSSIPSFSVDEFIADEVTDLSLYGLDNPLLQLSIKAMNPEDPSQTTMYEYLWGNDLDEDSIYFMKEGTTSVYAMNSDIVYQLLEQLNTFNLSEKLISITNIKDINSLDVSFGDSSYTLSIKRQEVSLEESNSTTSSNTSENKEISSSPQTEIIESFFLNDLELEEDTFKAIYQGIIGTKADTDLTNKTVNFDTSPVASFKYNFTDGTSQSYTFHPYDNQFYAHQVDEGLYVGCNIKQFNYIHNKLSEYTGY